MRVLRPLLTAGGVLTACLGQRDETRGLIRDSAGITIAENGRHQPTSLSLSKNPIIIGGRSDERSPFLLFRIAGVEELSTGSVMVANQGSGQLLLFDETGAFLKSLGRSGMGPGEFGDLTSARVITGDTIAVIDALNRRITYFSPQGELAQTLSVGAIAGIAFPVIQDVFSDGTLLVLSIDGAHTGGGSTAGTVRDAVTAYRVTRQGVILDSLSVVAGDENVTVPVSERGVIVTPRIFGKRLLIRVHGTRLYLTNGDSPEIQVFDTTGSLLLISRVSRDPVPVTRELTNAFLEEVPSRKAYYERFGEAMTYPRTFPPFGALVIDDSARIWVQTYPLPGQSENSWLIVGSDGVVQNTLRVPSSITIRGVRGQRALTVFRDSLGEESVRVYHISTAQPAP